MDIHFQMTCVMVGMTSDKFLRQVMENILSKREMSTISIPSPFNLCKIKYTFTDTAQFWFFHKLAYKNSYTVVSVSIRHCLPLNHPTYFCLTRHIYTSKFQFLNFNTNSYFQRFLFLDKMSSPLSKSSHL